MKYRTRKPSTPPYYWLYTVLLHHCQRDKKECNLPFDDFLKFVLVLKCHYCERDIVWHKCSRYRDPKGRLLRNKSGFQLDRKNNEEGYSLENCVVCCRKCNAIKGNTLTYEEMLLLREGLKKIRLQSS
jgi:5-methylcytosine-specific restriction endonuclease McrA